MTYGHAERALIALRIVQAETLELLRSLPELDEEELAWLDEVGAAGRGPGDPGDGRRPHAGSDGAA